MSAPAISGRRVRRRIQVAGVVQGVGFRPFVHRLASDLELAGHVGNDTGGVFLEVEGEVHRVESFERRLVAEAPPLARIYTVDSRLIDVCGERGFRIVESDSDGTARTFVSPDIAVCDDCLDELFDQGDRRYRYPFINCTNCGPRFTITVRLPYDRPNTTMAGFTWCTECAHEYHDPRSRRFHAQPVACAACGPRVWFESAAGVVDGTDAALAAAQAALGRGHIVAIKGLGGYHLACDAASTAALAELRRRKGRLDKPFAVMVPDLAGVRLVAEIDGSEAALLAGPQRPIVLLARRQGRERRVGRSDALDVGLSRLVAPGSPRVGVLLPYTPLHHLLFKAGPGSSAPVPRALVMTSGNLSDEPICYDDDDARERLGRIADAWLIHDRPIHVPCDDSVLRIEAGEELPIRRSRGYAPLPVRLPFDAAAVLATGGELKNTFCLASGRDAWMSQHIGDMGSVETLAAFERSTEQFAEMYGVTAERVATDLHPGYQTRQWAEHGPARRRPAAPIDLAASSASPPIGLAASSACPPIGLAASLAWPPIGLVQHHHAHIAAVMVEHGVPAGEQVIGYAFDGTGYGTDGAIWGGEILVAGYAGFERVAHLKYVPSPGGDATIRKPYRSALSHLWSAGIDWAVDLEPVRAAPQSELAVLERQLRRGVYCVPTSSMGRLFDAVSSLIGLRHTVTYEAQAAIELEALAGTPGCAEPEYRFHVEGDQIDPGPLLRSIVGDLRSGAAIDAIASGFHAAVARLVGDTAELIRQRTGLGVAALSGGVFQNVLLVGQTRAELTSRGFEVITHRVVPPNDGGLALGQAAVGGYRRAGGPVP